MLARFCYATHALEPKSAVVFACGVWSVCLFFAVNIAADKQEVKTNVALGRERE